MTFKQSNESSESARFYLSQINITLKLMLTINDFHVADFVQQCSNENIFLHKELQLETPICRYIPIDYLIEMLYSKKLYISNRRNLNDKREHGIKEDLRDMFSMAPISKNNKDTKKEAMRRAKLHEEAYSTCVSCWTKHIEESIMFWNCYGQSTCKISSTIGKLINSIKPEPYPIIISPVQYNDKGRTEIIQDKVFSKHEAYADEQEIRLCVLYYEHHILLNIDVQTLIESITINPFFSKYYQQFIQDSLEEKYSFLNGRIKKSHLLEYKS